MAREGEKESRRTVAKKLTTYATRRRKTLAGRPPGQ